MMKRIGHPAARLASAVAAASLFVLLGACRDPATASGTAVLVEVRYDSSVDVDQLAFSITGPEGQQVQNFVAPQTANASLSSPQTIRLLLADALDDRSVTVGVTGLRAGESVAQGENAVDVRKGHEVRLAVELRANDSVDGGAEEPDAGDAGEVDAGEDAGVCAGCAGCCQDGECIAGSVAACGSDGGACVACDEKRADTCADGECRCGEGAPCSDGTHCEAGTCVCDPSSCSGCCDGNTCHLGDEASQCGAGGSACETCPAGQTCTDGACSGCNAKSCADGCCSGSICNSPSTSACGSSGSACMSCPQGLADGCVDGQCSCGNGMACQTGQRCEGGQCVCDGQSCPNGCCSGNTCLPGDTAVACGSGGDACQTCPGSDTCEAGVCSGCASGNCPGCCSGATCHVPSTQTCGVGSAACQACDEVRDDTCSSSGECRCGSGPTCGQGLHCIGGACTCDATSCAGCCSNNTCLTGTAFAACGAGGGACQDCTGRGADNCSPAGVCRCGSGAVCGGLACVAGICL